jgi:hypothetical protein
MRSLRPLFLATLLGLSALAPACGGGAPTITPAKGPHELSQADIDADPTVLLPPDAVAVATVDARAAFTRKGVGDRLSEVVGKLVPVGDEAGFSAPRDLDRVTAAAYSTQGADVAAILTGRFDVDKIAAAARNHTTLRGGGTLVESTYAGRTVYTVANVGFTVLSPRTALAGTETGIRRALDRVRDGRLERSLPKWVQETLDAKAAFAGAGDFTGATVQAANVAGFDVPFAHGAKSAKVVGKWQPPADGPVDVTKGTRAPGIDLSAEIVYGDEAQARQGADGLRKALALVAAVSAVSSVVPRPHDTKIDLKGPTLQASATVDDDALARTLGGLVGAL